jgi:hypothetical protein
VAHYLDDLADRRGDDAGLVERNVMAALRGDDLLAHAGKGHKHRLILSMGLFPLDGLRTFLVKKASRYDDQREIAQHVLFLLAFGEHSDEFVRLEGIVVGRRMLDL